MVCLHAPRPTAGDISLRLLREADLPRLERWLAQPHVAAWWREATDASSVRAKYGPRIRGEDPTHMYVIEHAGQAIGFIQWYRWADYPEHAARIGAEQTSAGVDLAIGDADRLGIGIGSRALALLVEQVVFADPAITACVSDPEARNARSLRAFAKAGFSVRHEAGTHAEPERVTVRRARPA